MEAKELSAWLTKVSSQGSVVVTHTFLSPRILREPPWAFCGRTGVWVTISENTNEDNSWYLQQLLAYMYVFPVSSFVVDY